MPLVEGVEITARAGLGGVALFLYPPGAEWTTEPPEPAVWGRPTVDHSAELEAALERLVAAAPATSR